MIRPSLLVVDARTKSPLFYVPLNVHGQVDRKRASALLLADSLRRGSMPEDYEFMVPLANDERSNLITDFEVLREETDVQYLTKTNWQSVPRDRMGRRERQVLALLEDPVRIPSNKTIADAMGIKERTVKFHITNLLARFGVNTRHELRDYLTKNYHAETELVKQGKIASISDYRESEAA
jgi:DNA-binding CsgD family transcriptional regulator